MKKLFIFAFALMFSFTSAFANEDNNTGNATHDEDNETPDSNGGGTSGEIYVITFRGWCGEARIRRVFDHEPSYLETLGPQMEANQWCDIVYGDPFSIIGIE